MSKANLKLYMLRCLLFLSWTLFTYVISTPLTVIPIKKHYIGQKNAAKIVATQENFDNKCQYSLNALELCLCGAFSTMFGDFVMHPIDTIKITQQASATAIGFLKASKQIFLKQGILGFYQGVGPYLIADGLSGAVKFATFELSRTKLKKILPEKFSSLTNFICAAGAMVSCSILLVPGEVLKTRLQAGSVKSVTVVLKSILKDEGIKGLFAGYYATLVRDVPYTMLELGLYEATKSLFVKLRGAETSDNLVQRDELLAAAFTGAITGFLTTPLDLIKTKLMMQSTSASEYSGVVGAFQSIYKAGGMNGLFVGSFARVLWLLPFTTIYLGVYEKAKRILLDYRKIH
eukprot:gene12194-16337_t